MQSAQIKWKMPAIFESGFRFAHTSVAGDGGIIMQKRPSQSISAAGEMEDEEHPRRGGSKTARWKAEWLIWVGITSCIVASLSHIAKGCSTTETNDARTNEPHNFPVWQAVSRGSVEQIGNRTEWTAANMTKSGPKFQILSKIGIGGSAVL